MKNFFGKFFKTVAFLACLVVLLYLVSCIFGFKYEEREQWDGVMGSSYIWLVMIEVR